MDKAHEPQRRRWLRYSLRSFLILLTVLCVWMGVVASKAVRQKRAVEAIQAAGGQVHFDYDEVATDQTVPAFRPGGESSGPLWLRNLIGDEYFRTVVGVGLTDPKTDDETVIEIVKSLPNLKYLHIVSPNVTDRVLTQIASRSNLCYLSLNCQKLTAEGLRQLGPLKSLVYISSFKTGGEPIPALNEKTWLEMSDTPLPDAMQFLSDRHFISIQFDTSLDQSRVPLLPITASLSTDNLRTALKKILAQHDLGFIVRGNSVVITTSKLSEEGWAGYTTLHSMFPSATIETDW